MLFSVGANRGQLLYFEVYTSIYYQVPYFRGGEGGGAKHRDPGRVQAYTWYCTTAPGIGAKTPGSFPLRSPT